MLTVWWIAALILGGIHVFLSHWRDLGSPVILSFGVAIASQSNVLTVLEYLWIFLGVLMVLMGWVRANRRAIYRPILTGCSLFIVALVVGMPTVCVWWSPDMPGQSLVDGSVISGVFFCALFGVLALERPRPRALVHPQLRRSVPITENH